jgi:RimJ/RimL family protein N-acetyltransferase
MGVHLEPWGEDDLPLLEKTIGDPEMMKYLGGAESAEKLAERHLRYLDLPGTGTGQMFKIVDDASGEGLGSVGFWDKTWRDEEIYETGWFVIPSAQGRGVATAVMRELIDQLKTDGKHRFLHAFPAVENAPSNAISRKLGFTLVEEACEFEYPKGNPIRCNDWRLDLLAD